MMVHLATAYRGCCSLYYQRTGMLLTWTREDLVLSDATSRFITGIIAGGLDQLHTQEDCRTVASITREETDGIRLLTIETPSVVLLDIWHENVISAGHAASVPTSSCCSELYSLSRLPYGCCLQQMPLRRLFTK